ncbi:MAG: restriction endonuclease [Candidatus Aenigmarchaeota archaeon]|nr:restriction endonuclease [Candidatus Aenigmarchaeota archaeon]
MLENLRAKNLEKELKILDWKNFEKIVQEIFEVNGFRVKKNFRFKTEKNYEIDLIAVKENFNFSVDCKRLGKGRYKKSEILKAVRKQEERTKELKKFLERNLIARESLKIKSKNFYSLIVTLFEEEVVKEGKTLVVPVCKLNSFLNEVENYVL